MTSNEAEVLLYNYICATEGSLADEQALVALESLQAELARLTRVASDEMQKVWDLREELACLRARPVVAWRLSTGNVIDYTSSPSIASKWQELGFSKLEPLTLADTTEQGTT